MPSHYDHHGKRIPPEKAKRHGMQVAFTWTQLNEIKRRAQESGTSGSAYLREILSRSPELADILEEQT